MNHNDFPNFNESWKLQTDEPAVAFGETNEFLLHSIRCKYLSEEEVKQVLQSKEAQVENHRSVGNDDHVILAAGSEARSSSNISVV